MLRSSRRTVFLPTFLSLVVVASCQSDQGLPFEVGEARATSRVIGAEGGVLAAPPSFSLNVPPGALTAETYLAVVPAPDLEIPAEAGRRVGGGYDLGPAGLTLAAPGRVELRLPESALDVPTDALRLVAATLRPDGGVDLWPGGYDAAHGIVWADVRRLGPVAPIVTFDVLQVQSADPPSLVGGGLPTPAPTTFAARCGGVWAACSEGTSLAVFGPPEWVARYGEGAEVLGATVDGFVEVLAVDGSGVPTSVRLAVQISGLLRVRVGRDVFETVIGPSLVSGTDADSATATGVTVVDGVLELDASSRATPDALRYEIRSGGGSMRLLVEQPISLAESVGPPTAATFGFLVELVP